MPLMDHISDLAQKFGPSKSFKSGGIGSGHGMVAPEDDLIVSKPTIVCHSGQIFFNFLAMCCFASVAAFQAKWKIGPSGLSGLAIFISVTGMLLSAFMLFIPVAYERYYKLVRLARALKEVRVGFILTGTGVLFSLLIAYVQRAAYPASYYAPSFSFSVTISAWTQPGCKDKEKDPHSEALGDLFKTGLPGWCSTKKAGAVFFWFAFGFWAASLTFLILDWRSGKLHVSSHRDPPFQRPAGDEEEADDDIDATYTHIPPARNDNSDLPTSPFADTQRVERYPQQQQHTPITRPSMDAYGAFSDPAPHTPIASTVTSPITRPSMDAYGAFSDPAPTGFGGRGGGTAYTGVPYTSTHSPIRPSTTAPPILPEPDMGAPMVSRTMQYADPYAAVRASIAGQPQQSGVTSPPSYDAYPGYR